MIVSKKLSDCAYIYLRTFISQMEKMTFLLGASGDNNEILKYMQTKALFDR